MADERTPDTPPPQLLPEVPPYENGEDSAVGNRRFQRSMDCLEWRLASAINSAIHFLDYAYPDQALKVLRDAREDFVKRRA